MAEPAAAGAGEGARALTLLRVGALGDPQTPPPSVETVRDDRAEEDADAAKAKSETDLPRIMSVDDSLSGPMDIERVRVKLEVARVRLSGPWSEIPVGRVYDSPPDSTDEGEYDALEKAYNQAFHATSSTQLERSERTDQAGAIANVSSANSVAEQLASFHEIRAQSQPGKDEAFAGGAHAEVDSTGASPKVVLASAGASSTDRRMPAPREESVPVDVESAVEETAPPASAPSSISPQLPVSTHEQQVKAEGAPSTGSSCVDASMEEGQQLTDGETEASRTTEDGTRSEYKGPTPTSPPSSPQHHESSVHSGSTEVPTTPPEAKESMKYGGVATIDPSLDQRSSTDGTTVGAMRGDENLALNDFLVAELQLFAGQLLGRDPLTSPSTDHDVAHVTSLQLFHNHQRALMDFDADSKRYDSWTTPSVSSSPIIADGSSLVEPPAVLCQNPFQSVTSQAEEAGWTTLLKNIRPLPRSESEEPSSIPPEWETKPLFMRSFQFHKSGLNAVTVKRGDGESERRSVARFLAQLTSAGTPPYLNLVACASSDVHFWQEALRVNESLQIYPSWGSRDDRQRVAKSLNEQYARDRLKSQVVLTSFEAFAEDSEALSLLPFQLAVIDMPDTQRDQVDAKWPCVLSQRCRQRILMCSQDFVIDARRLLHFILPGIFSSRRKFLAWNYAALDPSQIQAVCSVIERFTVLSDNEVVRRFIGRLAIVTQENSEQELAALGMLNKQGIVRPVAPLIKIQTKPGVLKKICSRAKSSTPTKKAKNPVKKAIELTVNSPIASQSPKLSVKKRRGSDGGRHSRKRITRCGKCAGCLSEDCMVCGHCKDMKKYGGPGLRKQSCKNRKCLNPKSWGLPSKRRKRSKQGSGKTDGIKDETDDLAGSMNEDSDMYDDQDDMAASYSSMDSDRESIPSSLRLSARGGANSDSDGGDSTRLSDDGGIDSPRSINLLLPASDTLLDDNLSLSDLSARSSSRSRVMRCGKCAGCTAPDCMKCRHCLDMKKYGGPGLRKQSCKNRKCIVPKAVVLNQGNEDEYIDETGNVVSAELLEAPELSDPSDSTGPVAAIDAPVEVRSKLLSVIQQCAIFVEPRLVFQCSVCTARFCSKPFLDFHKRVEHKPLKKDDAGENANSSLNLQASRLFLHPITQNAIVASQLRQQDRSQRACPLGYAKLEGSDFQYFLIQPYVVLGRLQSYWRELYKDLGVRDLKGLPGGAVDCHLGNDRTITEQHALISWDAQLGQFVITCLSVHSRIAVDGQGVSFSSSPLPLRSRALVQIGASTFYFLLPHAQPDASSPRTSRRPRIPREDVRAWVHAAVEKRRAKQQQEQQPSAVIKEETKRETTPLDAQVEAEGGNDA